MVRVVVSDYAPRYSSATSVYTRIYTLIDSMVIGQKGDYAPSHTDAGFKIPDRTSSYINVALKFYT